MKDVIELTEKQRTPEWFALRKFLITSTAAYNLVLQSKNYTRTEGDFLNNCIGISSEEEDKDVLSDEDLEMEFKESEYLMQLSSSSLKELCRKYGQPVSGKKEILVQRIQSGPVSMHGDKKSILETVCTNWFMKPLARNQHLSLGSKNETYVLLALKDINMLDTDVQLEYGPVEFGLVQSKTHPWLASSIDGFVILQIDGRLKEAVIEIKSMTTVGTKIDATNRSDKSNMLLRCTFGDNNFRDSIPNKSYRMQALHHALVMKVNTVLFIIADKNKLVQLLLIDVYGYQLDIYKSILDQFKNDLNFVHDNCIPFPKEQLTDERLTRQGYHVNVASIKLHLQIWKGLYALIKKYEKPLPPAKMIVPTGIAYWNITKVHVDIMSRLLKHINMKGKHCNPAEILIIRLLLVCVANAFIAKKILNVKDSDLNNKSVTYKDIKEQMCKTVGSFDTFVKDLAKNWFIPCQRTGFKSSEAIIDDIVDENTICYNKLPMERKMTVKEMKCFHAGAIGINNSRKKKDVIFNSGYPKWVRLNNNFYTHIPQPIVNEKTKKTIQRSCAVCLVSRREKKDKKTTQMCKVCGVPLCITKKGRSIKTCFEKWHETNDLEKLKVMMS